MIKVLHIVIIAGIVHSSAILAEGRGNLQEFDDWIVAKDSNYLCDGYYVEPEYDDELEFNADNINLPLEIDSNEGKFISEGKSTFSGNVIARKGNRRLRADLAEIDTNKDGELQTIHAVGDVRITDPGLSIDGSEAYLYENQDVKVVKDAKFRMYSRHVRGTSSKLRTRGKYLMYLPDATYTTCAPNSNSWVLKSKKVKLNKESGRGEAWNSVLYIKDMPIFYWPYVNFPIDNRRQTGFLQPSYVYNKKSGTGVVLPFYWNIASNYDATITPYATTKRGFRLLNEFRYLTGSSNGIVTFDFLPRDRAYNRFRDDNLDNSDFTLNSPRQSALKDLKYRYGFALKNRSYFGDRVDLDINYAKVGDDNYIQQIGPEVIQGQQRVNVGSMANAARHSNANLSNVADTTNHLLQKLSLRYKGDIGTTSYTMQQYQTLHPIDSGEVVEQYKKLPEIGFQSNTAELPLGLDFRAQALYTDFKIKDDIAADGIYAKRTHGKRYYVKPMLARDFSDSSWYINPNLKLHHVEYNSKLSDLERANNVAKSPRINIPVYSIDSGLVFERDISIAKTSYTQTLEPRAYFLYVPDMDQDSLPLYDTGVRTFDYNQLFRDNRYSGYDRQSEATQLSLGVGSKFLTDLDGTEKASIYVGQSVYFRNRTERPGLAERINNNTKRSPIASLANYNINPHWSISGNLVWDQPEKRMNTAGVNIQFKPEKYKVVNFGYTFTRTFDSKIDPSTGKLDHVKQAHLSSAWRMSQSFSLIGKVEYDIHRQNLINLLGGVEYYACCTNFRVVAQRYRTSLRTVNTQRKYDTSIGLQIVFKGLAGVGSTGPGILAAAVPGYEAPSESEF